MKKFIGVIIVATLILTVAAMMASCQKKTEYPDYKIDPDYVPTTIPVTQTDTTDEETTVPEDTVAPVTGNGHVDFFGGTGAAGETGDASVPTDTNGNIQTMGEEEGWSAWVR